MFTLATSLFFDCESCILNWRTSRWYACADGYGGAVEPWLVKLRAATPMLFIPISLKSKKMWIENSKVTSQLLNPESRLK